MQVTGGVLLDDEGQLLLARASLPPRGSAVRVKSRFRRYSANCDSAFAADLARVDAFFELVRLPLAVGFLGIDQDFLLCATLFTNSPAAVDGLLPARRSALLFLMSSSPA